MLGCWFQKCRWKDRAIHAGQPPAQQIQESAGSHGLSEVLNLMECRDLMGTGGNLEDPGRI